MYEVFVPSPTFAAYLRTAMAVSSSKPEAPTARPPLATTTPEKLEPTSWTPLEAVYVPAPENCCQTIALEPTVTPVEVCTQPVLSYVLQPVTNTKSPPWISAEVSKSVARVSTQFVETEPVSVTV